MGLLAAIDTRGLRVDGSVLLELTRLEREPGDALRVVRRAIDVIVTLSPGS